MGYLNQLLETAKVQTSDITMSNEEIVTEIQRLDGSQLPTDRHRMELLQSKLFCQNAGLIVQTANRYNRGNAFTSDEEEEIALAVFTAARRFDPERGVKFSACLPW